MCKMLITVLGRDRCCGNVIIITVPIVRASPATFEDDPPTREQGKESSNSHPHSPALSPLGKPTLAARGSNPGALAKQSERVPPLWPTSGAPHLGTQAPWGAHAGPCWILFLITQIEEDSLAFLVSEAGKDQVIHRTDYQVMPLCLSSPLTLAFLVAWFGTCGQGMRQGSVGKGQSALGIVAWSPISLTAGVHSSLGMAPCCLSWTRTPV